MLSLQGEILKKKALKRVISSEFLKTSKVHAKASGNVQALKFLKIVHNCLQTLSGQKVQEAQAQILNEFHLRAKSQHYLIVNLFAIREVKLNQALEHAQAHG